MPATTPTFNGSAIATPEIARKTKKFGTENEAANGAYTFTRRGTKRTWVIQFPQTGIADSNAIDALYDLDTPWPFVDQNGATWYVLATPKGYDSTVSQGATHLYDITLEIREV